MVGVVKCLLWKSLVGGWEVIRALDSILGLSMVVMK